MSFAAPLPLVGRTFVEANHRNKVSGIPCLIARPDEQILFGRCRVLLIPVLETPLAVG
jgi:hypothetical protein